MDSGTRKDSRTGRGRGFTLIELLIVIVVLVILIGLLLPAINAAMRTARNAAVSAEINQLAQALANFKSKYGDYPPSRFLAVENGNYAPYLYDTTTLKGGTLTDPTSLGTGDITLGQLAQRSVAALRKFFPRMSTTGLPSGFWYDFNGNGGTGADAPYILHGHECLVLFLGGVPLLDSSTNTYTLTGFGKDPTNPFSNMIVGNGMYNANRQSPFYEFTSSRLFLDPNNTSGVPAYYDTLNTGPPSGGVAGVSGSMVNFYAYFSAYGNGNYDPNDVNFNETDGNGSGPLSLNYYVNFPLYPLASNSATVNVATSPSPNPYTTTQTETVSKTLTYWTPQTFQIISSGVDGIYGPGGQFVQSSSSQTMPVPFDPNNTVNTTDSSIRQYEYDNLTNFKSGRLD